MLAELDLHNCAIYWPVLAVLPLSAALGAVIGRRNSGMEIYPRLDWTFRRLRDAMLICAVVMVAVGLVQAAAGARCPG